MKSVIRYFGGKGQMAPKILKYFSKYYTKMQYVEPCGGSGALLFLKEPSPIEVYNDLESNVYSLFKVLANEKLFVRFKKLCDVSYYSRQLRAEYVQRLRGEDLSLVNRAFMFWYVNRSSHNGVGGFSINRVIRRGMSKSVSDFLSSVDKLSEIHERLSRVIVENLDVLDVIQKHDSKKTFFYMDPPYHWTTRTEARYKQDMSPKKHRHLVDLLLNIQGKVLLSGYRNKEYVRLEDAGWKRIDFEVKTQTGNRKSKTKVESLWKNY